MLAREINEQIEEANKQIVLAYMKTRGRNAEVLVARGPRVAVRYVHRAGPDRGMDEVLEWFFVQEGTIRSRKLERASSGSPRAEPVRPERVLL